MPSLLTAPVNKIIPFSVVDGPGSRSAVFFQGCGFDCKYCHNPETIEMCNGCGACIEACPAGALYKEERIIWDEKKCCLCDACLKICKNNSSPRIRIMTSDEILLHLKKAMPFIAGITVSGGECTQQEAFITELFQKIHLQKKTAFVDTNGQRSFLEMPELFQEMDQAMLDVKAWNDQAHIKLTGKSNKNVLENLYVLAEEKKLYEVRTVIVPEALPNEETVEQVSKILNKYENIRYKLIQYRPFGVREQYKDMQNPTQKYMQDMYDIAKKNGVKCIVLT